MVKTSSLSTAAINALTTGNSSILYNNQTRDLVLYSGSIGFVQSSVFNLEINTTNGECLILKNNSSLTNYVNFNVSNQGQLNIITNGNNKIVNIQHHNGSTSGLSLNDTLVLSTATELNKLSGVTATTTELNYVDTTPGVVEASKALIADSNRDITNIRNLQTENLTVNGTLVTSSAAELNYNDIATMGTAESAKALVIDINKDISGIRNLSATNLTGELQTSSQPNITSVGILTTLSTNSLTINGTQITATATEINQLSSTIFNSSELNKLSGVTATTTELNYVDTTPGTAEASKALVVDSNRDITNIRNLQTENLTVNGTLVTSSAIELNYNDIGTIGIAEPAKVLVVDMNKDILGIRNLTTTNLSGTIQTTSQPNITSLGTMTSLSTNSLTLNGTQVISTASELNVLYGIMTTTSELNKLHGVTATTNEINKLVGLTATADELNILDGVTATYTEINVLDGITSTTNELNYVDTTPGTAEASKALILDLSRNITNINNLTVTNITGTLATASQPNITSVGTLTSLSSSGVVNITNNTASTTTSTGALRVTGGVGIGDALNVGGSISATGNIIGTLATTSQPNITSVGTLGSLTVNGIINSQNQFTISRSSAGDIFSSTIGTHIFRIDQPSTASNVLIGTTTSTGQGINLTTQNISRLLIASTGDVSITNSTASTNTTTGALRVTGGVGIGGALNVGGSITSTGNITGTLATASQPNITSVGTLGSLTVSGQLSGGTSSRIISTGDTNFSIIAQNSSSNYWPHIDFIRFNTSANYGGDNLTDWRIINYGGPLIISRAGTSISGGTEVTFEENGGVTFANIINADRIRARASNIAANFIGGWDDANSWGFGEHGGFNAVRLGVCDSNGNWNGSRASLALQTLFYSGSLTSDSDYRLKTDINPLSYGLNEILNLNPKKYKLLSDEKTYYGLIAHEVQEQLPELVFGQKDAINGNNEPVYQGLDYVKITPVLINAIKELNAKNIQLEQTIQSILERLNNLEN